MTRGHMMCMTPASEIIARLGGFEAVADLLGITRNAVQRWTYPTKRERQLNPSLPGKAEGLGDRIPMEHWASIVAKSGGKVTLDELMTADVAQIVEVATGRAA